MTKKFCSRCSFRFRPGDVHGSSECLIWWWNNYMIGPKSTGNFKKVPPLEALMFRYVETHRIN